MFIINLNYIVPLEELDRHMTVHVKFLQIYYKKNIFVTSGRKVPRTGGIILALAKSKKEVEEIMSEDPFCRIYGDRVFDIPGASEVQRFA